MIREKEIVERGGVVKIIGYTERLYEAKLPLSSLTYVYSYGGIVVFYFLAWRRGSAKGSVQVVPRRCCNRWLDE